MRKVIIMFALAMGIITANAQENVTVETTNGSEQPTLTKEVYPQKEADGVENVVRVKAAVRDFPGETNFSVITGDGSFYSFSAPIIGA